MIKVLGAPHSWISPVESSSTEVSGVFEVPQSHSKWIFRKSSCCVFAQKLISLAKISVDRDQLKYQSTSDNYII